MKAYCRNVAGELLESERNIAEMLQEDWEYYWNAAGMLHLQEYCRNTAGIKNTAEIVDEYCGNTAAILQEYLNTTGILQICAGILRESDRNTA